MWLRIMAAATGLIKEKKECISECRYYSKYGRIEDEEVIKKHNELIGYYREKNAIIDIEVPKEPIT